MKEVYWELRLPFGGVRAWQAGMRWDCCVVAAPNPGGPCSWDGPSAHPVLSQGVAPSYFHSDPPTPEGVTLVRWLSSAGANSQQAVQLGIINHTWISHTREGMPRAGQGADHMPLCPLQGGERGVFLVLLVPKREMTFDNTSNK